MKNINFTLLTVVLLLTQISSARPQYLAMLQSNAPQAKDVSCKTCHAGSSAPINPFGRDFARIVLKASDKSQAFKDFLKLDSDGDGVSNETELLAGKAPGIANSFRIIDTK